MGRTPHLTRARLELEDKELRGEFSLQFPSGLPGLIEWGVVRTYPPPPTQ